MSETEKTAVTEETATADASATTTAAESTNETKPKKCTKTKGIMAAVVVVILIILGVVYMLEKEDRASTDMFASLIAWQEDRAVVATVNGFEITGRKLNDSMVQFSQVAEAQGADVTDQNVLDAIREQALEVLVNTTLLRQEAESRGISVTDDEVSAQIEAIKEKLGGAEVLIGRMTELGIGEDRLFSDVQEELIVQQLLDQVFAESEVVVSDEEVQTAYDGAGGEEAGLPPLEEVRPQVEEQLLAAKQQEIITTYIDELKTDASIAIAE